MLAAKSGKFIRLAFANVGGGVWGFELLGAFTHDLTPGCGGQLREFIQRFACFAVSIRL
jgi:hypothetical protein